jgi:hypothetical protein
MSARRVLLTSDETAELNRRLPALAAVLFPGGMLRGGKYRAPCRVDATVDIDIDRASGTYGIWLTVQPATGGGTGALMLIAMALFEGKQAPAIDWALRYLALAGDPAAEFVRRSQRAWGGR